MHSIKLVLEQKISLQFFNVVFFYEGNLNQSKTNEKKNSFTFSDRPIGPHQQIQFNTFSCNEIIDDIKLSKSISNFEACRIESEDGISQMRVELTT